MSLYEVLDLNFRRTDQAAKFMRCQACGSLFPDRFPTTETLGEAYEAYYTAQTKPRTGLRGLIKHLLDSTRRGYLDRETPATASILDYGCGSGAFLNAVAARKKSGTDMAPVSGDFRWLSAEDLRATHEVFDWITLGHVLEHLPNADEALADLTARLAPDGGLWIATPNAHSLLFRAFGPYARDVDFPRHRQVYSTKALTALLARHGLAVRVRRPPRLNAVLTFLACVRTAFAYAPRQEALRRSAAGAALLLLHLISPSNAVSPELVVVAKRPEERLHAR